MLGLIPLPYRILGAVLIVLGALSFGYYKGLMQGRSELELYKAKALAQYQKLQVAYEKAKNDVNVEVVTKYVDRIVYITKWRTKNVEIIKEVPSNCELSNGWVHVHDSSASGKDADRAQATDGASSGIKDTEALETVVDNYGACAANTEKLKAWQNWYTQQQAVVGKINRDNGVKTEDSEASESTAPPLPYSSDDVHIIQNNTGIIQR